MATDKKDSVKVLREAYESKGYIRIKMDKRQGGRRTGWEIRLRAANPSQAKQWSRALKSIGIDAGNAYARGVTTVLPVYGRTQVEQFLKHVKPKQKSDIPNLPARTDMRRSRRASPARPPKTR